MHSLWRREEVELCYGFALTMEMTHVTHFGLMVVAKAAPLGSLVASPMSCVLVLFYTASCRNRNMKVESGSCVRISFGARGSV
jgi:K+ transporter